MQGPIVTINPIDFLDGDSTELEFKLEDFNFLDMGEEKNRYIKPVFNSRPQKIKYENSESLAEKIILKKGEQVHALVVGDFIFGDFIEALLVKKNRHCKKMHISTLGMSQENTDSLHGLMTHGFVGSLTLMVSNYFYSHERKFLIPYTLEKLDIENRFDFLVVRNHTKIILMEIDDLKLIISGSANLRSSNNVEQFITQENEEIYSFYLDFFESKKDFSIINKEVEK